MDTYYVELLEKVKTCIENEQFQEAYKLVEEELTMPYIPKDIEQQLIEAYNTCRSALNLNKGLRNYGEEDLEEMLFGSLEEQFLAIEQLKNSNIRNHLDVIAKFYEQENVNLLVSSLLIEAMMEQNITDDFHAHLQGFDVTFSPCAIEPVMECDGVVETLEQLREWFENENPTFLMMCVETLVKEAYLRLPFNIDEDEALALATSIARYVFYAHEEYDAWNIFCEEKKLAQFNGYELLLNTYDNL